jgi:hypothetical protein
MLPEIPHNNWKPRPDQMALWGYLQSGGLRAVEVAHKRWGKDGGFASAISPRDSSRTLSVATAWYKKHYVETYSEQRKRVAG